MKTKDEKIVLIPAIDNLKIKRNDISVFTGINQKKTECNANMYKRTKIQTKELKMSARGFFNKSQITKKTKRKPK